MSGWAIVFGFIAILALCIHWLLVYSLRRETRNHYSASALLGLFQPGSGGHVDTTAHGYWAQTQRMNRENAGRAAEALATGRYVRQDDRVHVETETWEQFHTAEGA